MRRSLRRVPLRWTITAGATAVVIFALLVASLAMSGLLHRSIAAAAEESLRDRVEAVRQLAAVGDLPSVLETTGREAGQIQVLDASGTLIAATPGLGTRSRFDVIAAPPLGTSERATVTGTNIDDDPDEEYLVLATSTATPDGDLTVYGVTSLNPAADAQSYLESRLLLGLPLMMLVTGAVIFVVVGRALRPVDLMRSQVDQISATNLSARLVPTASDDEIARLGDTLNRLLERLDLATTQQHVFAASASHELRSPLSAIRTNLEVGLTYPDRTDWEATARDALIEIARLERLSGDLRSLTKRYQPAAGTPIDVANVVMNELSQRSDDRLRARRIDGPALVSIEPDAFLQVIRNLLDNAQRHARSEIVVELVTVSPDVVEISVFNDGPPLAAADRERVFEPFTRLDEARSIDAGGSGLGLAIAASIVTSAGGSINVSERDDGAEFVVRLPIAGAS